MSYIVIVDMDQPDIRRFVGIKSGERLGLAEFDSLDDVKTLKDKHHLGVFEWLIIGVKDDACCELDTIGPRR